MCVCVCWFVCGHATHASAIDKRLVWAAWSSNAPKVAGEERTVAARRSNCNTWMTRTFVRLPFANCNTHLWFVCRCVRVCGESRAKWINLVRRARAVMKCRIFAYYAECASSKKASARSPDWCPFARLSHFSCSAGSISREARKEAASLPLHRWIIIIVIIINRCALAAQRYTPFGVRLIYGIWHRAHLAPLGFLLGSTLSKSNMWSMVVQMWPAMGAHESASKYLAEPSADAQLDKLRDGK